jgi:acyl phosphate:glycerol-3-phosphate acyltransferase
MVVLAVFCAWLVGAVPASDAVRRVWRTDLSRVGSGNTGAGNATRSIGLRAGVLLAVLDGLKGLIPVLVAREVGFSSAAVAAVGLAAVAGNNWPVFAGRRGGRGLATSAGALLGFGWQMVVWPGVWAVIGWAIGGGIAGFLGWGLLPAFAWWYQPSLSVLVFTAGLSALMMIRRAQGNAGLAKVGLAARVLFDRDPRPVTVPARPLAVEGSRMWWVPALILVGFPTYVWLAGSRATDLRLSVVTVTLLIAAAASEFGAKYAFGELYRQGARSAGVNISSGAAFRAALVGTGVARLIPAGGVVTPLAMAWSVDDQTEKTVGAAVRATVLSYGGLAGVTGAGLIWASMSHPSTAASRTLALAGIGCVVLGTGLVAFAGHLRRLLWIVPQRFRVRVDAALVDRELDRRAWGLLTIRTILEAATLGFTLVAFGVSMAPSQVVGSFGVSQIVGGLPGSPGGLGVTEAGLLGALTLFGIPAATAAAPVLTFRVISFWLPALGGLAAGGHAFLRNRSDMQDPLSPD